MFIKGSGLQLAIQNQHPAENLVLNDFDPLESCLLIDQRARQREEMNHARTCSVSVPLLVRKEHTDLRPVRICRSASRRIVKDTAEDFLGPD